MIHRFQVVCLVGSFLLLASLVSLSNAVGQELAPLEYRNNTFAVDLGVGLWAWPVPCDADGDGDYDLIVSCPDKPSNGVWLFENTTGDTRLNKFPVFAAGKRLSKTVHYVMPSYEELNPGDLSSSKPIQLRVLSPGKEYVDFERTGLNKTLSLPAEAGFYKPGWTQQKGPKVRHNQWRYVDFDGDSHLDLIVGIEDWSEYGWDDAWDSQGRWLNGPLHGFVLLLRNTADNDHPSYAAPSKLEADGKPIDVFGCPSPNFGDFDGDGDLDLLCGEFLDGFTYFENFGSRKEPRYRAGTKLRTEDGSPLCMDLQMIVPIAFDWDRDGDFDLVVGDEDGRVALVECTRRASVPEFLPPRYFEQKPHQLKCGALATPYCVDWDDDGDFDIFSGNTAGYIEYFENLSGPGVEAPSWEKPLKIKIGEQSFRIMAGSNRSVQGPAEAKWGYTSINIADWDGDGLKDIVYNSILGHVEWLRNASSADLSSGPNSRSINFEAPQSIEVQWLGDTPKPKWTWWAPKGQELITQWRTTPVVHDFDGDSLLDIAMLDPEGYFSLYPRKAVEGQLVLLPPVRCFCGTDGKPLQFNDHSGGRSGRRKIAVTDWDGDGVLDLLLNSANADFYRGLGKRDGNWIFERIGPLAPQNIEGHDVSPATVDFDGNGVPDFLGGAEDGRFYYLRNPRSNKQAPKN